MTLILACYTCAASPSPSAAVPPPSKPPAVPIPTSAAPPSTPATLSAPPPSTLTPAPPTTPSLLPIISHSQLLLRLSHTLHMILGRTCAAHNMSIFVSTAYQELLPLPEQHNIQFVLSHLLYRHKRHSAVPIVMDRQLEEPLNLRIHMMIFFVRNLEQLMHSVSRNAPTNAAHKHKLLVILQQDGDEGNANGGNARDEMRRIFGYMLHQHYNIDVLVLLMQPGLGKLRPYSFWPYGEQSTCKSVEPVAVQMQQALLRQLYPRKLHNLHGCPLQAILWNIPPYIQLKEDGSIEGWDAAILKLLAAKLNFSIAVVPNEPPGLIGGVSYMNGTLTGAFRMLRERRANLTLGCAACMPARYKYLAATSSYNQIEFVVVLRARQCYSSFEIMLFPFDDHTWQLLLLLAVLRLATGRWLGQMRFLPAPLLIGWTWLLFTLRIGYESSIFDYVHNAPERPLPRTLDEALQKDYSFIMDYATYRMVSMLPVIRSRTKKRPGLPTDIFEQLLEQPLRARIAALSSRDFLAHYLMLHPHQHHLFSILDEKVMNNMVCMHFPMGSYIAQVMSELLLDLRSFGICQQLSKSYHRWQSGDSTTMATHKHPSMRRIRKNTSSNVQFDESMRFIYAALSCLLIGEALILLIFGLELLSRQACGQCLRWIFERI